MDVVVATKKEVVEVETGGEIPMEKTKVVHAAIDIEGDAEITMVVGHDSSHRFKRSSEKAMKY